MKKFCLHKKFCVIKKDNRKSKSFVDINMYYTKLTQCQQLGTVYTFRFQKSVLIYTTYE